ncbi:protein N-lysine methyltransferase METTL21D-like [Mytilus californianus]|uniref:protein N-lysine methyltransferase METTL21D-like n=1 Tax=Mytilus californianus TaxID=6549 RepID=UPI002248605C|nr:protein N-lysine methyltransferase METTL21D-like [Mytilus californianus]
MSAPMADTFVREIEKNNEEVIKIHQLEIGDVGCVVWDAAIVLSKYFETEDFLKGQLLKEKNIIELGAGTGVVGIIASTFGANVTITDLPEFNQLINMNIAENKHLITGNVTAKTLVWGTDIITDQAFDYVCLADCIYYEQSLQPLVKTIADHCNGSTTVLCCYEERTTGNKPELERKFFELMTEKFHIEEIPLYRQDPQFRSKDIYIMKFKLKNP